MILNTQKQKGFSLLELLLVVAVGAILILAGLSIYRNITTNTQNNDAVRLLNVIKQELQKLYQGQPSYGAATALNAVLVNMDAIPASFLNGTQIVTPFGTNVTVTGATQNFTVTFASVPQDACIRLFTSYTQDDKDLVGLNVGGTAINMANITPAQANTSCSAAAAGSTMIWTFQ